MHILARKNWHELIYYGKWKALAEQNKKTLDKTKVSLC